MELTPTLILNLALLIVPPVALVLVFRQWLARHIRWTVALTALCDVLLFWDELFYYESFGLHFHRRVRGSQGVFSRRMSGKRRIIILTKRQQAKPVFSSRSSFRETETTF